MSARRIVTGAAPLPTRATTPVPATPVARISTPLSSFSSRMMTAAVRCSEQGLTTIVPLHLLTSGAIEALYVWLTFRWY
jgi:hypothetical protein